MTVESVRAPWLAAWPPVTPPGEIGTIMPGAGGAGPGEGPANAAEAVTAADVPVPSTQEISRTVERLNRMADIFATSLRFSIHEGTKNIMVRVVDTASGRVLREIPPERVLDAAARMQEALGLMVDVKF